MTDVYVFGTYFSYNQNLVSSRSASRASVKWRSQEKVPEGSIVSGSTNDWYYINGNVHICNISDLDYQLKNTDPMSDDYWIKKVQGAIRVDRDNYIGINANKVFEYDPPPELVLDATNPNDDRFPKPIPTPRLLGSVEYSSFAEERLELGYDYGASGGHSFATGVTEVADDREQRNASMVLPLGRWQLGDRNIADSEVNKLEEVSYIKQFHLDRLGSYQGFRYKDWADYKGKNQLIGNGDGVKTQFQLRKGYFAGDAVTYRPIQKPVPGTVFLFENGVAAPDVVNDEVNGWHINVETGVLTRASPLPNGVELTADFEFDVPVWFEKDAIDFSLDYYDKKTGDNMYRVGNVFVVEGRLPASIPWEIQSSQEITEKLDLGIVYDTVESYEISNNKLALKSGYTRRENKRDDQRLAFNLGSYKYNQEQLDRLLGYFWNAKGKAFEFPFVNLGKTYKVRFNQDQLNLKFEAASDEDALFSLAGLKLQLKEKVEGFVNPPFSIPFEPIFVNPTDPNDPTYSSSGSAGYPGSAGVPSSSSDTTTYSVSSFIADGVGFDVTPPEETGINVRYYVGLMVWAGESLHLFVTSNQSSSVYRYRLIHYKLNPANGWNFEYQSDTELLKPFIVSGGGLNTERIYKTTQGTSIFLLAGNTVPFGSVYVGGTNGLLRIDISKSGILSTTFVDDNQIPGTFSLPFACYGDRLWFYSSNNIGSQGVFNGIEYFGTRGGGHNFINGFPIVSTTSTATEKLDPLNIWVNSSFQPDDSQIVYVGEEELLKYFAVTRGYRPYLFILNGDDGSFLIMVRASKLCENGKVGCSVEDEVELTFFYLKQDHLDTPTLIDVQYNHANSTIGDAYYIQNYNGQNKSCDKQGNILVSSGSKLIYYRSGSGVAMDITSQVPGVSLSGIRNKPACTPYGFAVISHGSSDLFTSSKLAFVQNNRAD